MFSDNKKDKQMVDSTSSQNIISKGTKIVGDFNSQGDFRIDGTIEGNIITTGKVVVGRSGNITGTLQGTDAYFEGKFSGKLTLSGILTLKTAAQIEGEVEVGKLAVEPGAIFNVTCVMKGIAKDIDNGKSRKSKSEKTA
ncbi:polymer-forming cytoskeletal protein [Postechiella marina]|uniref:Polymer-forming cytoskeletal protein n=1 Tax=Postechiella marina TaxID=943941 RepID=A0ABP8C543_9FLAO